MNFQQLRSVLEAVRCGFNLTEVANALHTSQPGVSRQIRELEEELGVEIFIRSGKRLIGLTREGKILLPIIEQLLQQVGNLRRVSQDLQGAEVGTLSIAATHSQARYVLPHVVRDFRKKFPRIVFHLHQGSPRQVAEMLLSGVVDIGVATEALAEYERLHTFPCYRWTHSIVVPFNHPLLELKHAITLNDLVRFPIITYELGYTLMLHLKIITLIQTLCYQPWMQM
jgi:LysR family transcriptional regulator, cys regulon transcriptional activator